MLAESALVGGLRFVVDEAGVIGAGLHAVAAAHAALVVHQHDAVGALEGGLYRADRHTGRVVAVVAQPGQADHGRRGHARSVHFVLQHGGAELAYGRQVLHGAVDGAGLAANALADVHQHAVALAFDAGAARGLAGCALLCGCCLCAAGQAETGGQRDQFLQESSFALGLGRGRRCTISVCHVESSWNGFQGFSFHPG
ncbi:hypothetical protein D3C78_1045480 [compost metagenome]